MKGVKRQSGNAPKRPEAKTAPDCEYTFLALSSPAPVSVLAVAGTGDARYSEQQFEKYALPHQNLYPEHQEHTAMDKMVWNPQFETGIPEIDTQHKRIVVLVNQMREAKLNKDMNAVAAVITEMVDYTLSHFAFEEVLMEDAGYRFLRAHKRVHDLFTQRIPEFQARFAAGEDITEELHNMLSHWLDNHIRGEDQGYVKAIKAYMEQTEPPAPASVAPAATPQQAARRTAPSTPVRPTSQVVLEEDDAEAPGFWTRLKYVFYPKRPKPG